MTQSSSQGNVVPKTAADGCFFLDQSRTIHDMRGQGIRMNCTRPSYKERLATVESSWNRSKNTLNSDHTLSISAKYMFSWTRTESQSENSAVVSDTPGALVHELISVPERYLSELENEIIDSLRSKQVLKNVMKGTPDPKICKYLDIVGCNLPWQQKLCNCISGNICSIFYSTNSPFEYSHELVFINWLCCNFKEPRSQVPIWMAHLTSSLVETIAVPESKGAPCIISPTYTRNREPCNYRYSFGILENGKHDFLYRDLLYCDNFEVFQPWSQKSFVGSLYMSPLGLWYVDPKQWPAISTISLRPSWISTNHIFDYLIPDILNEDTTWDIDEDADGSFIRIYLDVGSFLCEYPAAAQVIEVMKYSAWALLTLCSFATNVHLDCWIALLLIYIRRKLRACLFYKVLGPLKCFKILFALCLKRSIIGNERRDYCFISRASTMAFV